MIIFDTFDFCRFLLCHWNIIGWYDWQFEVGILGLPWAISQLTNHIFISIPILEWYYSSGIVELSFVARYSSA